MKCDITRISNTKYLFDVTDNDKVILYQQLNPYTESNQRRLLELMGISLEKLLAHLIKLVNTNDKDSFDTVEQQPEPFVIYHRPIRGTQDTVKRYVGNDPEELLKSIISKKDFNDSYEPIIQWDHTDTLACLDIDYHTIPYDERPSNNELITLYSNLQPKAFLYHTSHGQGFKAYYKANATLKAKELAACAGLSWLSFDGRATAEIKYVSRHPLYYKNENGKKLYCSDVYLSSQNDDVKIVGKWLCKSIDEETIEHYMKERGYRVGYKYTHSICPIDPGYASHGEPVYVGESGIYCHSCEALGKRYKGKYKPGWVPWSALLNGVDNRLAIMIKKLAHWPHVRNILTYMYPGAKEEFLRLAYSASLKLVHGSTDPRVNKVFTSKNLIRFDGRWMLDGKITLQRDSSRVMLKDLPCVQKLANNKIIVNPSDLEELRHGENDLGKYGIFDVTPIRSCKIWGQFLNYDEGIFPYVIPNETYTADKQPRYANIKNRMDIEDAWKLLEKVYPNINRNYVELLIAAKGVAEGGLDQPIIIVNGPSGSGKSITVDVAASICGDFAGEPLWNKNVERMRQGIMNDLDRGDFIKIDEVFKIAEREEKTPREALDPVLNMGEKSSSHKMYVGPVRLGRLFVLVFTDITLPNEAAEDLQLGRRLAYVRLYNRVPDWKDSSLQYEVNRKTGFRGTSREFANASDAILSHVIDKYFTIPPLWKNIVRQCGFEMLENAEEYINSPEILKEFFKQVCQAKPLSSSDANRYPGRGWKRITRDYEKTDFLSELWAGICDKGDKWQQSRKCSEISWGQLIGYNNEKLPVFMDTRAYKTNGLYIRFRTGAFKSPVAVNEEIPCHLLRNIIT